LLLEPDHHPQVFFAAVLSSMRRAFLAIGLTSGFINILALTGSFFMLQVYDRVVPGRSLPTLTGLALIAASLYVFQGVLELLRSMLLVRVGISVDERLSRNVIGSLMYLPARTQIPGDGLQSVRDMDQVRSFLSGVGPTALFDLPWMPFYLALCFLFHFWIGVTALCGSLVLISLAILAEFLTRRPAQQTTRFASSRTAFAEATRRNWEVVLAMGFVNRVADRWADVNRSFLRSQMRTSDIVGGLSTASRILRMMLQSTMIGVGAILVIKEEASGGIMIASSILVSRALAPVELAIGQWKGFVAARQSWARLKHLMDMLPAEGWSVRLPAPRSSLSVENVSIVAPGTREIVVRNAALHMSAGTVLGIIGPSASGKSSLVRAIAGVWPTMAGCIRFDHATLAQWQPEELGKHIGYLPQDIALFDGTIAENIARFDKAAPSEAVIAAAKAAGVFNMIVELQDGFDAQIGEGGSRLSAGQRQRVALARALYGEPFLVILDEPNSNLDAEGDAALTQALLGIRARGGIAVVVAHRPSALAAVDKVLLMRNGLVQAFGPKDDVLRQVLRMDAAETPSVRLVTDGETGK
jgi:PrtD family type I secretion system ABC transporter